MSNILLSILSLVIITINIYKNKELIKKLTRVQILGAGISYLLAILISFVFIYYGGNWITDQITNAIIKYIITFTVVWAVLAIIVSILNKILHKTTDGILPKDN